VTSYGMLLLLQADIGGIDSGLDVVFVTWP
jgi:hypothetical protein